jgi:hypothetical protein
MGSALLVRREPQVVEPVPEYHDPLSSSIRISDATNAEEF